MFEAGQEEEIGTLETGFIDPNFVNKDGTQLNESGTIHEDFSTPAHRMKRPSEDVSEATSPNKPQPKKQRSNKKDLDESIGYKLINLYEKG